MEVGTVREYTGRERSGTNLRTRTKCPTVTGFRKVKGAREIYLFYFKTDGQDLILMTRITTYTSRFFFGLFNNVYAALYDNNRSGIL